ncbi:MAG: ankyrin repeat domain-containing protein [Acidobacteriota bacterium]|nr:ankyrin repeat domain-containing protein [Acidobacteriota bacterium]
MRSCLSRLTSVWTTVAVLNAGGALAQTSDTRLVTAVARQDSETARQLLDTNIDVNATRADGATALLWTAHWNDVAMADRLIRAGANVNAADDHGVTALERACENGSLAMVTLLLAADADPNVARASGLTPLMTAARTGQVEVVRALLAAGADVSAVTGETRSSALMWAVSERHGDIAQLLLAHNANPQASTATGFTPLMFAIGNGDLELIDTLIAAGVDVNQTGADGTHALPYAIVSGQDRAALRLLDRGADPNGTLGGVTALHAAAGDVANWLGEWARRHGQERFSSVYGRSRLTPSRRLPLVNALLARGADPNARITPWAMFMNYIGYPTKGAFEPFACGTGDLRGATPLWVAAYGSNGGASAQMGFGGLFSSQPVSGADIIRALLAAGADQHLTTADGTTPFMVAAGLGRATYTPREPRALRAPSAEEAVAVLLEAGANLNAVNEADFTALHGAAMRGLNEVVEYLVAKGADINARDFRGRTAYRMAEGSKQSFQFQSWPETAALLASLGANTRLGIPGTVQERLRDATRTDQD